MVASAEDRRERFASSCGVIWWEWYRRRWSWWLKIISISPNLLLNAFLALLLWLFPLSFAYAVVKHRVLEIPVLLRRSARYLLVQRGFIILLIAFSVGVTLRFCG